MAQNFTNYMNKVADMLVNDGPIYDVWIKFQIGLSNPIVFDSNSTDKSQNLIASLEMTKSCTGIANDFTLTIQYDPFDMGQKTPEIVEQLDEFIAQAMATDFDDNNKAMRGRIQYGYNSTSDTHLASPVYEYFITGASSNIRFNSGLSTYTFTGVSLISADCDNTQSFPAHDNWDMLDVILGILYKYYGDPDNPPKYVTGVTPDENPYHYLIDIPDELYKDGISPKEGFICEAASGMTPWQYCSKLFDEYPLTKSQIQSGKYDDILGKLSYAERPRYLMYIEDIEGQHIIRIRHVTPALNMEDGNVISTELDEENTLKIDYDITWGLQNKNNLVVEWSPQVDLQLYLIRNAKYRTGNYQLFTDKQYQIDTDIIKAINENQFVGIAQSVQIPFDAQLTLVGIPADPPLGAQMIINPRILETVSRTAGVYMITGCKDIITTNGTYTTTLDVYRVKSTINDLINAEGQRRDTSNQKAVDTTEKETSNETVEPVVFTEPVSKTIEKKSVVEEPEKQNAYTLAQATMYSGPSKFGAIVSIIPFNSNVKVLSRIDNYCYISYNGKSGYVEAAYLAYK